MFYWVTFTQRPAGCVRADNEPAAIMTAYSRTGERPVKAAVLPQAAHPQLDREGYGLCYSPHECAGRTSCPKRISCSE